MSYIISFSHAVWPMWWRNPNLTYLWFDMPAIRKEYSTLGKTCKPKTWASQGFKAAFCRSLEMHLVAANSSASCDAQSKDAQPSEATPKLVSVGLTPAAWATSGAGKTCSWFLGLNQHLFFIVLCFVCLWHLPAFSGPSLRMLSTFPGNNCKQWWTRPFRRTLAN